MSAVRSVELSVTLYGVVVGILRIGPRGRLGFFPESEWIENEQLPRLGLAFLRRIARGHSSYLLPHWFENLLPAVGSPLRKRVCEIHGIAEHDSASLLAILGDDLPGAVVVRGEVLAGTDDEDAAPDEDGVDETARFRFSVPGMQPKLSLLRRDDKWLFPAKDLSGGNWYVKFAVPGSDYLDLPKIEYATMEWARAAGFTVPACELVPFSNLPALPPSFAAQTHTALAVHRFDRTDSDGERVHQEDFAQALDLRDTDIYGGPRGDVDYGSIGRLVRDSCGQEALEEFVRRLAFVVVSGNTDAHLKNWSFQWWNGARRPTLAPLYDQVSVVSLGPCTWDLLGAPELAMSLGGARSFADVSEQAVRRFADDVGDSGLLGVFEGAVRHLSSVAAEVSCMWPDAMQRELQVHWAKTPVLRRIGQE